MSSAWDRNDEPSEEDMNNLEEESRNERCSMLGNIIEWNMAVDLANEALKNAWGWSNKINKKD